LAGWEQKKARRVQDDEDEEEEDEMMMDDEEDGEGDDAYTQEKEAIRAIKGDEQTTGVRPTDRERIRWRVYADLSLARWAKVDYSRGWSDQQGRARQLYVSSVSRVRTEAILSFP
jgi:hypothetical protein